MMRAAPRIHHAEQLFECGFLKRERSDKAPHKRCADYQCFDHTNLTQKNRAIRMPC